jgi:hypothetical protein
LKIWNEEEFKRCDKFDEGRERNKKNLEEATSKKTKNGERKSREFGEETKSDQK